MAYPIKINWKTEFVPVGMVLTAITLAKYFYDRYPERVANHWNFAGQVDAYTSKMQGAIAIPIMMAVMYGMFLVLPLLDPKKERYGEFEKVYKLFRSAILALLLVIYIAMGEFNLGVPIEIGKIVSMCVGILMIVIGNYMSKIKKNWFVGIKTPWTLSSENVWNKTHRVGGWLFVVYGMTVMMAPWLPQTAGLVLMAGGAIALSVGTMGYSYWIYKQENR